jgi:hypothetical protein
MFCAWVWSQPSCHSKAPAARLNSRVRQQKRITVISKFWSICLRKLIAISVFLSIAMLLGCDGDNSTSFKRNPFAGNWVIELSGDYQASGGFLIGEDGRFFENIAMNDKSGSITISGSVTDSGILMNGRISQGGSQVGTLQGSFSGNSGNGTWEAHFDNAGTWRAGIVFF